MTIVVDSSGWVEMFASRPLQAEFRARVAAASYVIVPTIVLYETYKILRREMPEETANSVAASLQLHWVVGLDAPLALSAAEISLQHSLPMADAIIYATALLHDALLVTSDDHFEGLPGVEYIPRPQPAQDSAPPATNQ